MKTAGRSASVKKHFYRICFIVFTALLSFLAYPHYSKAEGGASIQNVPQEIEESDPQSMSEGGGEAPDYDPAYDTAYEYEEPDFDQNRVSYPLLVLRTVAVLGALIIGIYLLFRLLLKNKNKIVTNSEIIKVLATYPLAANRIIQIVDIAGQVLILGVSDSSINLITEVSDNEVLDKIRLMSSKESKGTGSFKDQFLKLFGGKPWSNAGQVSYLSGYRKRINKMRKL